MMEEKGFSVIHNSDKNVIQKPHFFCEFCGKKYKYQSGLCKHQKKCKVAKNKVEAENEDLRNELSELKTKIFEQMQESAINLNTTMKAFIETQKEDNKKSMQQMESFKNIIPKIGNTYNNKLSINVYLNEKCKDAMNLTDFVENLTISLEDLVYTKNHGFVKGISNIFIKGLEDIGVNERPIHCSNMRSLKFYVKDENEWDLDNENKKLDKTIDYVAKKQIHQIKDWEADHPNWNETDEGTNDYLKMIQTIMGGSDENERQKNKDLIKKKLTESVEISKRIKSLKN